MIGIDKVVDTINKSYDEASSRLDLIPDWISYCIEYRERITAKQDEYINVGMFVFSETIRSLNSKPPKFECWISEPLSFDKILELKDKFGK